MPTNRERFFKLHGLPKDTQLSLTKIAKLSGFPRKALDEVYDKGMAAYYTNPLSVRTKDTFEKNKDVPMSQKLSPQQWATARVYAFVMKTRKVFHGADKHIAEEYGLL